VALPKPHGLERRRDLFFCGRPCPKTGAKFIRGQRYPITYYGMGSDKRKWAKAGVDARIHDLRHTASQKKSQTEIEAADKIMKDKA
jgi:hypothetical protein